MDSPRAVRFVNWFIGFTIHLNYSQNVADSRSSFIPWGKGGGPEQGYCANVAKKKTNDKGTKNVLQGSILKLNRLSPPLLSDHFLLVWFPGEIKEQVSDNRRMVRIEKPIELSWEIKCKKKNNPWQVARWKMHIEDQIAEMRQGSSDYYGWQCRDATTATSKVMRNVYKKIGSRAHWKRPSRGHMRRVIYGAKANAPYRWGLASV